MVKRGPIIIVPEVVVPSQIGEKTALAITRYSPMNLARNEAVRGRSAVGLEADGAKARVAVVDGMVTEIAFRRTTTRSTICRSL